MQKDTIFQSPSYKQFSFDEQVASVFDDMLERSIPYYKDTLKLCVDFLAQNAQEGRIYDIGCSTGNTLLALHNKVKGVLVGIDSSLAMINKAQLKAKAYSADITFICADCMEIEFEQARGFIANYTLQFIRPPLRLKLLKKIYNALESCGVLIISEKMASTHPILDKQMINYYYAYKAGNGYTKNEITTKREALENVLVPYSLEENITLLKEAGFTQIEVLFKWVNFGTLIAIK